MDSSNENIIKINEAQWAFERKIILKAEKELGIWGNERQRHT